MLRWTKLNSDFRHAEEEILRAMESKRQEQRISRKRRVLRCIVIPFLSGVILCMVISGTSVWGYGKIKERNAIKEAEKEKKRLEALKNPTAPKKTDENGAEKDKSAKDILYQAFYEEQEKERLEEEKLLARKKKQLEQQQSIAQTRNKIKQLVQDIKLTLQKKEFADQEAFLAIEARDAAEDRAFLARQEIRRKNQKFSTVLHEKEQAEQRYTAAIEEKDRIEQLLQEAKDMKDGIEKESLSIVQNKEGTNKEELLTAIQKIESAEAKIKAIASDYERAQKDVEAALEEKLKIDETASVVVADQEELKQEELAAIADEERIIQETLVAVKVKKEVDARLVELLQEKEKTELAFILSLQANEDVELVAAAAEKSRKFSARVHRNLSKLRHAEGQNWLRRIESKLKNNDVFSARLMAAYMIESNGFERPRSTEKSAFVNFPKLVKARSPEYQQASRILHVTRDIRLLWQTPLTNKMKQPVNVGFSPDGRILAIGQGNGIKLWNIGKDNDRVPALEHANISNFSFSPVGTILASSGKDGTIKFWDLLKHKVVDTITAHTAPITDLCFSPNGQILASASEDMTVRLWNLSQNNENIHTLQGDGSVVTRVQFSPDGRTLAAAGADPKVRLWDALTGSLITSMAGHEGPVYSVCFSPRNELIASAGIDSSVKLWNRESGEEVAELTGHRGPIYDLCFSPDSKTLASSAEDEVKIWNIKERKEEVSIRGTATLYSIDFSPDGVTLATAENTSVKLWYIDPGQSDKNQEKGKEADTLQNFNGKTLKGHSAPIINVSFSNDNKMIASASRDKTIKIWDISSGWDTLTLQGHVGPVLSVCFSMDDKMLVSAGLDSTVKLWDISTGAEKKNLNFHTGGVYSVSRSPDGGTVASAGKDGKIRLWNITSGKEKMTLKGHNQTVINVCFSPDGKTLASSGKDSYVKLWDVRSGLELWTLEGHTDAVFNVSFSPDGLTVASAGKDSTIRLWDVVTGQEFLTLKGHSATVYSVSFSHDGLTLASASKDGSVRLWNTMSGEEMEPLVHGDTTAFCVKYSTGGSALAAGFGNGSLTLWQLGRSNKASYVDYLSVVSVDNFDVTWKNGAQSTRYFDVPLNSHIGVLTSGKPRNEISNNLFRLYVDQQNWNSALTIFKELPEGHKNQARTELTEKLKEASDRALDQGQFGLAEWRLQQFSGIGGKEELDPVVLYLKARNQYFQAVEDSVNHEKQKNVHPAFAKAVDYLNQAVSLGLSKSALEFADDMGLDIVERIPEKRDELESISALEWLEHAEALHRVNQPKAIEYCLMALNKDEGIVESYSPKNTDSSMDFTLACMYSLRAQTYANTGDVDVRKGEMISQAIARLKKAKLNGWSDWDRLEADPRFDAVRSDSRFHSLISEE